MSCLIYSRIWPTTFVNIALHLKGLQKGKTLQYIASCAVSGAWQERARLSRSWKHAREHYERALSRRSQQHAGARMLGWTGMYEGERIHGEHTYTPREQRGAWSGEMGQVDSLRDEGMGREMSCRDMQSNVGLCLHAGVGGEAGRWGKLVQQHIGVSMYSRHWWNMLGLSRCCWLPLGREQVQKLQHTSVMCLHVYIDSLAYFYMRDSSTY